MNFSKSTLPCDAKSPTAIGKSSPALAFLISAGARLTVTFSGRVRRPEFFIAVLTLSFDSRTEAAGSPTISKLGIPLALSTSTVIIKPSTPCVVAPKVLEYKIIPPFQKSEVTSKAFSICRNFNSFFIE